MNIEILIVPFADTAKMDLAHLMGELDAVGVRASALPHIAIPALAYNSQRGQYDANALLQCLQKACDHVPALGVTEADLYAPGLNFVFGLAESPGRAAVVSLHRLHSGADDTLFLERAVKESVHELGHTFGLGHCDKPECVMHLSNSLQDTDRKGKSFCSQCEAQLEVVV
ncbi:MAG: archaemetzincin family Zn-dependent metalloprotease [Gammaproteobacteria bacterium]|jgi:archaemetzincin